MRMCAKCQVDDKRPAVTDKIFFVRCPNARERYHSSLLEAIYSQERCFFLFVSFFKCLSMSLSVSVLRSGTEVIGSLVAVCLCVGSVSKLECFIVPVCQTAAIHQGLEFITADHSVSELLRRLRFLCYLMLQIVTGRVFIALVVL